MRFHRAAKVDANQRAVVDVLRAAGCTVVLLHTVGGGCPDLLIGRWGRTFLFEVKRDEKAARVRAGTKDHNSQTRDRQRAWITAWRGGPVRTVTGPADALLALYQLEPTSTDAPRSTNAGGRDS